MSGSELNRAESKSDPLQNLMEEAQQLMEEIGTADAEDANCDADGVQQLMDSIVIDGFAIDSDEELEDVLDTEETGSEQEKEKSSPVLLDIHTSTNDSSAVKSSSSPGEGNKIQPENGITMHPLHEDLAAVEAPAQPKEAATEKITEPSVTLSNSTSTTPTVTVTAATNAMTSSPSLDIFRYKTSQFASNLASFAQKAASQVAAAAAAPPVVVVPSDGGPSLPKSTSLHSIPTVELDNEQKTELIQTHVGDLLPGERVIMFLSSLIHVSDSSMMNDYSCPSDNAMWCCCMTYYRILLFCTASFPAEKMPADWNSIAWMEPSTPRLLQMPLASMDRVEKSAYTTTATNHTLMGLVIYGKDNGRQLKFTTPSYTDTLRAHEALQTYAFPGRRNLGYLFAFESKRQDVMSSVKEVDGQKSITIEPTRKRFDAVVEFRRQFQKLQVWTCWTQMNGQYQLCLSYPSVLVGPASLAEASQECQRIIRGSASFRSEQRLPVLTWSSGVDGASLWRSSQPKVGLQGNRNAADELLLKHIGESAMSANALREVKLETLSTRALRQLTGSSDLKDWMPESTCILKILDMRPRSSAMANRTGGYGYENTSNYPGTTLQFCNIGNIHSVRDSYQKLSALCSSPSVADAQWSQLIEDTKWLSHIRLILAAAWEAAYWVHVQRMPVLLHCSHGWDRTSQVAILAQLFLDPHYRTREGFATLVEKDFMSFGHPFHTRCAHGEGRSDRTENSGSAGGDEGQISPIFLQFLDCVYQVVHQYPECFEFNTKYVLMVSEHIYSCRFGTMLCDTERERELIAGIRQRTHSLWDYLDSREDLTNKRFTAPGGILLMPLPSLLRNVSLWADRHCMYSPKAMLRKFPS